MEKAASEISVKSGKKSDVPGISLKYHNAMAPKLCKKETLSKISAK